MPYKFKESEELLEKSTDSKLVRRLRYKTK